MKVYEIRINRWNTHSYFILYRDNKFSFITMSFTSDNPTKEVVEDVLKNGYGLEGQYNSIKIFDEYIEVGIFDPTIVVKPEFIILEADRDYLAELTGRDYFVRPIDLLATLYFKDPEFNMKPLLDYTSRAKINYREELEKGNYTFRKLVPRAAGPQAVIDKFISDIFSLLPPSFMLHVSARQGSVKLETKIIKEKL